MAQTKKYSGKTQLVSFNKDVEETGRYIYNEEDKLSCKLANDRINKAIQETADFQNKIVFDVGCGDGVTAEKLYFFGAKRVCGIDLVEKAVDVANDRCRPYVSEQSYAVKDFQVGDAYTYVPDSTYDVVVFSRTLHHMADPEKAIKAVCSWAASGSGAGNLLIIEPNGYNPVLKILEKFSPYHVAHEEKSFSPAKIQYWLSKAGFCVTKKTYVNLVPMFCPNWLAKFCKLFEPIVERTPLLRAICCGQVIIYANKRA